VLIFFFLTVGI